MKKNIILLAALAIVVIGVGGYFVFNMAPNGAGVEQNEVVPNVPAPVASEPENNEPVNVATSTAAVSTPAVEAEATTTDNGQEVIGKSVESRDILAYHFGSGNKEILLVGGIHGGYAWNTALLSYQMMDHLKANPNAIPTGIKVTVIPALNPDGLSKVVSVVGAFKASDISASTAAMTAGRFNARTVDLNRNFDCGWKASGVWQNKIVSGGTAAFSEPESAAIRDYAKAHKITAVVAWYSAGGGVYSSSCGNGISAETQTITDIFAKASGYTAYKNFESYQVSGDMTDWFAKNNVPAIGVLLTKSNETETDKNLAGIKSLLDHYSKQ